MSKEFDKAKIYYNDNKTSKETKVILEDIFPEFKRKVNIKETLKALVNWAEGYSATGITEEIANDIRIWIEKQGEQNPAEWSKEDEEMFGYALSMIEWYSGINEDKSRLVSDWLKSLKERVQL